jgi:hypothetical protein
MTQQPTLPCKPVSLPRGSFDHIMHIVKSLDQTRGTTLYWGTTEGAMTVGPTAPVGATSEAAAEVGAEVVSTTGFLTSVVELVEPVFFSVYHLSRC